MRKRYPGKFEGCDDDRLAEVLYSITMDGCEADCGEVGTTGWYGLILHRDHGYIVSEDSQGFFGYKRFKTRNGAQMNFDMIEAELNNELEE